MLQKVNKFKKSIISFGEWHAGLITNKQHNLYYQLQNIATEESLKFFQEHMHEAKMFRNKNGFMDYALNCISEKGSYLEFGVWKGHSINYIANRIDTKKIHGFDSFEGVPEIYNGFSKNAWNSHGELPQVKKNVVLHRGWFDKSIPEFLKNNDENIAFLNIDCDIYSSTKTVLDLVGDRIQNGTIITFDEYFNYPNWQKGEHKAFMEFIKEKDVQYTYLASTGASQVLLRIDKIQK